MPNFAQSLLNQDLGHLQIIAEHWGIALDAPDVKAALPVLGGSLLEEELVEEIIEALPPEARAALGVLQGKGGRLPWAQFTRRFGEVREMGPGRRDRERPDREPISSAEILWYRGMVGRAFFDTARGTEEFAYVPDDLLALFPAASPGQASVEPGANARPMGRPAKAAERAQPRLATDQILDHACTLLAALRLGLTPPAFDPYSTEFIHDLLKLAGLLTPNGMPEPEATRAFLEAGRGAALLQLAQTWLHSPNHNDLRHVPNLLSEGEWDNDPLAARQFILRLLAAIPAKTWWSLSAFVADVRQRHPDFQRPAGDYDSWFLRDEVKGEFLRGFEHWDAVDGALIRYLICGPLHWLGILDLAAPREGAAVSAFRLSGWAVRLLEGAPPIGLAEELSKIHLRSDGRVSLPLLTPRAARYQLARFCHWEEGTAHEYRYRITPASLSRARDQGLRVGHLLTLLNRFTETVPPNIQAALNRWESHGSEARLQEALVLRLGSPEILQALRNSRAARFLGEPLGPAVVIVKPGAGEKVLAVLAEMGYLGESVEG